jgi:hypothetical protein
MNSLTPLDHRYIKFIRAATSPTCHLLAVRPGNIILYGLGLMAKCRLWQPLLRERTNMRLRSRASDEIATTTRTATI